MSPAEVNQIKEIIALLQRFKDRTDQLGSEKDVTITFITPVFRHFKNKILVINEHDSLMIQELKGHMLRKLQTRYTADQKEYLSCCSYLDPRFKNKVNFDMQKFKEKIKEINDNYTELIFDTQSQTLSSIETNTAFATPLHRQAVASPSTSNQDSFFEDDFSQEDNVPTSSDDVMTKISQELEHYARISMSSLDKQNLNLLKWWKTRKNEYPYLFKAVRALLCTPATSVPSERVFSEAGYISRARRSRILPVNLNNNLFIKKNMHYMPDTCLTQEQASEGLKKI